MTDRHQKTKKKKGRRERRRKRKEEDEAEKEEEITKNDSQTHHYIVEGLKKQLDQTIVEGIDKLPNGSLSCGFYCRTGP